MDNFINILSKIKIDFNHPKKSQILLYGIYKQELFEKYFKNYKFEIFNTNVGHINFNICMHLMLSFHLT